MTGQTLRLTLANQSGVTATGGPDTVTGMNAATLPTGWAQQLARFSRCQILLNGSNSAGSSPTLDVYIQKAVYKNDGTKVWTDLGHFTQVTTGAFQRIVELSQTAPTAATANDRATQTKAATAGSFYNGAWGDDWQVVWTIGGTATPTYTFQVTAQFYE